MAPSALANGLGKASTAVTDTVEGGKQADLARNTKQVDDPNNRITTDYGVKQWNTGKFNHRVGLSAERG